MTMVLSTMMVCHTLFAEFLMSEKLTGETVVSANLTLSTLIQSIYDQSGVQYAFADVPPVDDQDGGEPGGNIRTSYLYKPSTLRLRKTNLASSTDEQVVLPGPELKYNPGRLEPNNLDTWRASRKPLTAAWETLDGKNKFFTVNVHFGSKGGSSSIEGDARPPVNGGVDARLKQANVTAVRLPSFALPLSLPSHPSFLILIFLIRHSSRKSSAKIQTHASSQPATSTNSPTCNPSWTSNVSPNSKISMS